MSDSLLVLDQKKGLAAVSGNQQLADELLAMFIKELPGYKQSIKEELLSHNQKQLRNIIHKMHGGLRYLGTPALLAIVSQTDIELFTLSEQQLTVNIQKINDEIDRLLELGKY